MFRTTSIPEKPQPKLPTKETSSSILCKRRSAPVACISRKKKPCRHHQKRTLPPRPPSRRGHGHGVPPRRRTGRRLDGPTCRSPSVLRVFPGCAFRRSAPSPSRPASERSIVLAETPFFAGKRLLRRGLPVSPSRLYGPGAPQKY